MSSPPAAVDAVGISKWYGAATALDRAGLTVDVGSVHGLLGRNGAGKTTLLAALFGLVRPDEGSLRLFGRTYAGTGAGWLDGVGGFVETPRFYPYLTGRQNLSALARLDGGTGAGLVGGLLETVGLGEAGGQKVRGYSLGMRQRLGVAAALLRRPRLLILDEPTNGLDPAGARDLLAALRQRADAGLTVVLSSHDVAHVEGVCDAVTILRDGRTVFGGDTGRLRAAAPDPAWLLVTTDDEAAVRAAGELPHVEVARGPDRGLRVVTTQDRLDGYVLALGRRGVAVRRLTPAAGALESLFFRLTGDDPEVAPLAVPDGAGRR